MVLLNVQSPVVYQMKSPLKGSKRPSGAASRASTTKHGAAPPGDPTGDGWEVLISISSLLG